MIFNSQEFNSYQSLDCDVCIVGGGVAGIVLALELSKKLKIILLEGGGDIYDIRSQALYEGSTNFKHYPRHFTSRLRFLGGSSNHWEGSCRPLDSIDFEKRDWIPYSGWPITREELNPYYEIAHKYCQLNEFNYSIDYWEAKTDIKRLYEENNVLTTLVNHRSPPTRFGLEYKEKLIESKNIELYLNANCTSIHESRPIGTIERIGFDVFDGVQGEVVARQYVLALGGLENSRILLLNNTVSEAGIGNENDVVGRYYMDHPGIKAAAVFPNSNWPDKLKHSALYNNKPLNWTYQLSDEFIRKNKLVNSRLTLAEKSEYQLSEGIESLHQIKKARRKDIELDSLFAHLKNVFFDLDMVVEGIYKSKFDGSLFDSAHESAGYLVNAMMEQTPDPENRVVLSDDTDSLGQRKLHLEWSLSEYDKTNMEKLVNEFAISLSKSGLCRVKSLLGDSDETDRRYEEIMDYGFHHMGGTRMADTSKYGVVDRNLKVFDRNNLFITGSSVFATGGYVPPTLTIAALSAKLAQYINNEY